jgi:hypothetical protein
MMTETPDGDDQGREGEGGGAGAIATPEAPPDAAPASVPRTGRGRQGIAWLAALFALLIAGVAASPLWAPAIMPLLPWGQRGAAPAADYAALAARLDEIEKQAGLSDRALDAVRSAEAGLAQRLDRLEAAGPADSGLKSSVAAAQSALARLGQRLDAADARSASTAADLQATQRGVARLDKLAAGLGDRVGVLEGRSQAEIGAGRSAAALLLSLMQLRAAVETGRPFAPEYEGFAALARDHPDLVAAAGLLADTAHSGVASNAALRQGLAELAGRVATTAPPPARQKWWEQALSQLRGLVTVRRIGVPESGPAAAVDQAQTAFAAGDLPAAVASLEALSGADAAAVRPWLQTARARLAAEAALGRLQDLLTARLGTAPAALPNGALPKSTPEPATVKSGAPS